MPSPRQPGWESLGTPKSRTLPVDAFETQGLGRFGEPKVMILKRYCFDVLGWGNLETTTTITLPTGAFGTQDWGHLGMPWAATLLEYAFSTLVWGGLGNPNPQYCQNMPLKCQVWEILGAQGHNIAMMYLQSARLRPFAAKRLPWQADLPALS